MTTAFVAKHKNISSIFWNMLFAWMFTLQTTFFLIFFIVCFFALLCVIFWYQLYMLLHRLPVRPSKYAIPKRSLISCLYSLELTLSVPEAGVLKKLSLASLAKLSRLKYSWQSLVWPKPAIVDLESTIGRCSHPANPHLIPQAVWNTWG